MHPSAERPIDKAQYDRVLIIFASRGPSSTQQSMGRWASVRQLSSTKAPARQWQPLLAAVLLLALIGTSCAIASDGVEVTMSARTRAMGVEEVTMPSADELQRSAQSQERAPDPIDGTLIGGGEFNPAALDNGDVVLWFWAPW